MAHSLEKEESEEVGKGGKEGRTAPRRGKAVRPSTLNLPQQVSDSPARLPQFHEQTGRGAREGGGAEAGAGGQADKKAVAAVRARQVSST